MVRDFLCFRECGEEKELGGPLTFSAPKVVMLFSTVIRCCNLVILILILAHRICLVVFHLIIQKIVSGYWLFVKTG